MNFQNVEFLISAASKENFPTKRLPEIAFAGKSNVGKSSVINRLLQRKNFARVGDKPGKTVHVNYFTLDSACYLVDLPGYGFAKVSASEKERWGRLMEDYFAANRIDLGVLIVDYRHPPTNNDITMARWFLDSEGHPGGSGASGGLPGDPVLRGEGERPGRAGEVHSCRCKKIKDAGASNRGRSCVLLLRGCFLEETDDERDAEKSSYHIRRRLSDLNSRQSQQGNPN